MKKHFINIVIVTVMLLACLFALSSCSTTRVEEKERLVTHDSITIRDSVHITETHPSWNLDTTAKITDVNPKDTTDYTAEANVTVTDNDGKSEHIVRIKYHSRTKTIEASGYMKTPVINRDATKEKDRSKETDRTNEKATVVEKKPSIWEQMKSVITTGVILIVIFAGILLYAKYKLR